MSKALKEAIALAGSGKRYSAMSLVRSDPGMAATVSKLVHGKTPPRYDSTGNMTTDNPSIQALKNVSDNTVQNISDAQTVMQTLPELELAAQILVSSVLSPKDMMTVELVYKAPENLVTPEVNTAMTNRVRVHFEQNYKIKQVLPRLLRDVLFETGSYPVAVIPENAIDDVINGQRKVTMESLADHFDREGKIKPLGLLGPVIKNKPREERKGSSISFESMQDYRFDTAYDTQMGLQLAFEGQGQETFTTVTDNYSLLKIPQVNQKIREQRIMDLMGSRGMRAMEAYGADSAGTTMTHEVGGGTIRKEKINDRELSNLIYRDRNYQYKPITTLKTQEQLNRRAVGSPLIMHLPSEAVIPVFVPGNIEQHVGFFILIDEDGHPIQRIADVDYYQQLNARMNSGGSFPSAMLQKVKANMQGFDNTNNAHLDYSARVYGEMIEQDLLARLRNGVYGNGVALAKREEVYRIMFARALAKQHTQLLFMPIEFMTYFALRYNGDGMGKSMLDDLKIINSLRSMLLFANVMAAVKNSMGRTEVKIKMDEHDPDPQKTFERVVHEILRSRQQAFPVGTNSPMDIVDWVQRAGFEFVPEGHPGLPDMTVEFGEKNTNYAKVDNELDDDLRKRSIMGLGLTPQSVDAAFEAEFATSVLTNNILLSKRVMNIQDVIEPQLADHIRKVMMNDEELIRDLRAILEANADKVIERLKARDEAHKDDPTYKTNLGSQPKQLVIQQLLYDFVMGMEVTLPKPNSVTLENQVAALDTYTKTVDAALDAYISSNWFTADVGGDASNYISTIKEVAKAHFIRKWLGENGVMPELAELTTLDDDGRPLLNLWDSFQDHIGNVTKVLDHFMNGIKPIKDASNLNEKKRQESDTSTGGAGGGMGMGGDAGAAGGGLGGGGDDFGMGDFGGGGFGDFGDTGGGGEAGGASPGDESPLNPEDDDPENMGAAASPV
ncbi:hypothetical protein [Burkholderia phage FLC9]|nr:hypothetical protein [Burkholderia phage FLC9]